MALLLIPSGSDGAGTCFRGFFFAILWRTRSHQIIEQMLRRMRDLAYGAVEGLLIGFRRLRRPGDLAYVLQGRGVHLFGCRGWLEVMQGMYIAAHTSMLLLVLVTR